MAPPRPQEEEEVSDGSAEQDISLRRSPRHRVKRNVAGGKGKQKKDATPARKQLNTEANDNGRGKQNGTPRGGKEKTTDDGKGKQKETPSGGKKKATNDRKEKQKKTDNLEEKGAKDMNKNKRDIEDNEGDVEFVRARKIRVSSGNSSRKKRKVVARRKVVEVLEEDDDEEEESYYTLDNEDESDSNNSAHEEGREVAAVDGITYDDDNFDAEQETEEGFGIDKDDEEDNHAEASSTRTGHTAGAAVLPSSRNAGLVATNLAAQSIARVPVIDLLLGDEMPIRGMSKSESLRVQQKHVADRIRVFVKTDIFRRIKFINSDAMFQKAITLVMNHENVPQNRRGQYQSIYESTFNDALNTKRSSCEQSGGRIVKESLAIFKESGMEFFTIDELCKLRRSETEREKEAFFWFYGTYLECVCGKRNWGRQKQHQRVSEATDKGSQAKTVTISDEAFALLIFENYIDKWISTMTSADNVQGDGLVEPEVQGEVLGRMKQPRHRGKYTSKKSGHCKYGGWSREGMARFNELYKLVREDRACPQAAATEGELLAFCKAKYGGGIGGAEGGQDEGAADAGSAPVEVSFVEAAWDLDD